MKRSTFIKKVLLLNTSVCLGFNLLSCAEEDFEHAYGNGISKNDLTILGGILLAHGTIYITSPSTNKQARKNLNMVRVELNPKLILNRWQKFFKNNIYRSE